MTTPVSPARPWFRLLLVGTASAACVLSVSAATALSAPYTITEFPLAAGGKPFGITTGPDGNVWFTEQNPVGGLSRIGSITPAGAVTMFSSGITPGSAPSGITTGPDGNLWFTEYASPGRIAKSTTAGSVTQYATTTSNSGPYWITSGPDGNLWFTEWTANKVGKITPLGAITEYTASSLPFAITAGPDGNLWFTRTGGGGGIGRITPAGTITNFTVAGTPYGITTGPDGNIWFTKLAGNTIATMDPSTGVVTQEYTVPTASSSPAGITTGADGNLWFAESATDKIGRITPAGVITEFSNGITAGSRPYWLTSGADGNMWFTETDSVNGNRIGRLTLSLPLTITTTGSGSGSVSSSPAGIDCGSTCTANFDGGTSVTLTAQPGAGSVFAQWGGACSGSSSACTVSMSEARTVTATFDPAPTPSPTPSPTPAQSNESSGSGASSSGGTTPVAPTLAVRNVAASNQASSATITSRVVVNGAGSVRQVGTRATGQSARTIWRATARESATALCTASRKTPRAGTYRMTCTLGAAARAELKRRSIRVRLATTFTPTGGAPISRSQTVVLKRIKPAVPAVTG